MRGFLPIVATSALLMACIGTTGGSLVEFSMFAAGPKDAVEGAPLTFVTAGGYQVTLRRARMHLQAVYFDRRVPLLNERDATCFQADSYVGEVRSSIDVNALSPSPQLFPRAGQGVEEDLKTAELWTSEGGINEFTAESQASVVLEASGTATKGGFTIPFSASFHVDRNREKAPESIAKPGSNPICLQRIIKPLTIASRLRSQAKIILRVDPRQWFQYVDFSSLPPGGVFPDKNEGQPSIELFNAFRRTEGVYSFEVFE